MAAPPDLRWINPARRPGGYRGAVKRLIFLLILLAGNAAAQYTPQLEAFAGSKANFASLTGGLEAGKTIMLSTITTDGMREEVIFTPQRPLPAADAARLLEAARAALVAHGIASPTPRQIGAVLMGGNLATPKGPVPVAPMIAPANPAKPLVLSVHNFAGSPANYRNLMRGLTQATTVTLTDAADRSVKLSFTPPGAALTAEQARQTLLAASELLASFGIFDPTLEELRASFIGGTAETPRGKKVLLRGVLVDQGK